MKILHVFDHSIPLHSGYTFRSCSILEYQRKLGWKTVHVTSPKHALAKSNGLLEEMVDGFHFYRTNSVSNFMSSLPIFNQLLIISALKERLEVIVKKEAPDIIQAHSPLLNGRAAISIGKKYNIPVVYEIRAFWEDAAVDHGTTTEGSLRYKLTKYLETQVAKEATAVTTICEGLKNDLISRGIPPSKITVIPNAVDSEKFVFNAQVNEELQKKLGLENKNVIGFIGSFYAYEGIDFIMQALPKLIENDSSIRFLLVGGGPEEERIKKTISKLGIEPYVILTGRVPHDEVQEYYNLIDIFIYPRLSMRLTELVTPLKPLEAMAQGRLVIASDVGGHKELITPGVTGELFKANDEASLIDTVIYLFQSRNIWDERKKTARRFVEAERSWEKSISAYEAIFQSLLHK